MRKKMHALTIANT